MSGLMGAIGQGLSAAGYAAGEMYAKSALLDQQNDAEFERQKRLVEFKARVEDRERTAQVARVDAKAGEMADEQLAPTRGLINAGITDRSAWTPEHQAAVDQSLGAQRKDLKGKLRTDAAVATGDISPKDAAGIEYKQEAMVYKALLEQSREEGRDRRTQLLEDGRMARLEKQEEGRTARSEARIGAMLEGIERRAALREGGRGEKDHMRSMLAIVENERKDIASRATDARLTYQAELKTAIGPSAKKAVEDKWGPKLEELDRQRKAADEDYDYLREKAGMPRRGAKPAADPKPATEPKPQQQQRSDARPDRQDDRTRTTAAPAPQRKVGEKQTVQSGPNKGKTVTWDGKGWRLS